MSNEKEQVTENNGKDLPQVSGVVFDEETGTVTLKLAMSNEQLTINN